MYWPCGVPQIFAQHATRRISGAQDDSTNHETLHGDNRVTNGSEAAKEADSAAPNGSNSERLPPSSIIDVKVARAEHILAALAQVRNILGNIW